MGCSRVSLYAVACCAVVAYRRWNNTVGLTLRSLCYDPIVEGCWIHKGPAPPTHEQQQHADTPAAAPAGPESTAAVESAPSSGKGDSASKGPRVHPLKKMAGTAASFVASGIMHEFILLYALAEDDKYPAGVWFMMFFVQVGQAWCVRACGLLGDRLAVGEMLWWLGKREHRTASLQTKQKQQTNHAVR